MTSHSERPPQQDLHEGFRFVHVWGDDSMTACCGMTCFEFKVFYDTLRTKLNFSNITKRYSEKMAHMTLAGKDFVEIRSDGAMSTPPIIALKGDAEGYEVEDVMAAVKGRMDSRVIMVDPSRMNLPWFSQCSNSFKQFVVSQYVAAITNGVTPVTVVSKYFKKEAPTCIQFFGVHGPTQCHGFIPGASCFSMSLMDLLFTSRFEKNEEGRWECEIIPELYLGAGNVMSHYNRTYRKLFCGAAVVARSKRKPMSGHLLSMLNAYPDQMKWYCHELALNAKTEKDVYTYLTASPSSGVYHSAVEYARAIQFFRVQVPYLSDLPRVRNNILMIKSTIEDDVVGFRGRLDVD